ncbi:hypothetical protein KSP39_PZI005307 [Platanthera zijinensis]|uniref:Polyprotein n=1 Tax=Platanthera zijinensis TaxID=2320716 RepID=A0AAP0GAZ1_9ASPA
MRCACFNPSLKDFFSLARLQEQKLIYSARKSAGNNWDSRRGPRPKPTSVSLPTGNAAGAGYSGGQQDWQGKRLASTEMDERRDNGLCFWCDNKFTPGHRCLERRQPYALQLVLDAEEDKELEDTPSGELALVKEQQEDPIPHVSVHALDGTTHFQTMRVTTSYQGQPIYVLIDSGSTHNFLDSDTARRLKCQLTSIPSFDVAVANGKTITSSHKIMNFQWKMQGVIFTSDMLILPLGGCEMVLGVQWLVILGVVQWDFQNLKMKFVVQGRKISLRGSQHTTSTWMRPRQTQKLITHEGELNMLALCQVEAKPTGSTEGITESSIQVGEDSHNSQHWSRTNYKRSWHSS